jgi:hypothetical protein
MASILLSYLDSDKAAARTLAKLLEGAGHTVYGDDATGPALRLGKSVLCIIVVWSAGAVTSPYVYEDARVALRRGRLIQVFTESFDRSTLAPMFRAEPLIPIEDREQILRAVVQRASRARAEAYISLEAQHYRGRQRTTHTANAP